MNPGQQQFQTYIIERVQEDKVNEANTLLGKSFQRQKDQQLTQEYFEEFIPKILQMIKPEHVTEVEAVMKKFSGKME